MNVSVSPIRQHNHGQDYNKYNQQLLSTSLEANKSRYKALFNLICGEMLKHFRASTTALKNSF